MIINIGLNSKSIRNAKKQLLEIKKLFETQEINKAFLMDCSQYLLSRMEFYLQQSGIGSNVVSNIMNSWEVDFRENGCIFTNRDDKAVFVEFGVGIQAEGYPHPTAYIQGYEYNQKSNAKASDGSWHFYEEYSNLDLPQSALDYGSTGKNGRLSVYTRGSKGVWYAYNSLQDLRMNAKTIWQKTKERFIR